MKKFSFRRVLTVLALTAASFGAVTTASSDAVRASGGCNTPYFSGHSAYMNCTGTGYAAFTVVCSGFGFLFGGGDVAVTRTAQVDGSKRLEIYCGWNKWPKSVKQGWTRWI